EPVIDRCLVAQIQLLAGSHEKPDRTGFFEPSNNGRSNESAAACNEDPSVLVHESDAMLFQIRSFQSAVACETARRSGSIGMRKGMRNSGRLDVKALREVAGGVRFALDRDERSTRKGQPAIRPAVSILVECRGFDDPP